MKLCIVFLMQYAGIIQMEVSLFVVFKIKLGAII